MHLGATKNGGVSVNGNLLVTPGKNCSSSSSGIEVSKKLQSRQQQSRQKPLPNVSFDEIDSSSSSSSESEDEAPVNTHVRSQTNQLTTNETPTFVGRHVTEDNTKSKSKKPKSSTSTSSTLQQLLTTMKKFESQYLKPILLKQERNESTLKCLYANQKKMQSTLRKQKVIHSCATKAISLFFCCS